MNKVSLSYFSSVQRPTYTWNPGDKTSFGVVEDVYKIPKSDRVQYLIKGQWLDGTVAKPILKSYSYYKKLVSSKSPDINQLKYLAYIGSVDPVELSKEEISTFFKAVVDHGAKGLSPKDMWLFQNAKELLKRK